jgi:glycosyltransferase involved in cell wall biosynthesis
MLQGKGYEESARALLMLSGELDFEAEFIGVFENQAMKQRFLDVIAGYPHISYLGNMGEERFLRLKRSHVFLLPTYFRSEGQPLAILEAYAAGNFVITTDHGGIQDIFENGVNGFQVEKRSPSDVARKLRSYARLSAEERLSYALRNHEYAASKFREQTHLNTMLAIINESGTGISGELQPE